MTVKSILSDERESADLKALMEFLFPRKRGYGVRERGGGEGRGRKSREYNAVAEGKRVFPVEILFLIEQQNWFSPGRRQMILSPSVFYLRIAHQRNLSSDD